jgi:hypothetical protein
MSIKEFFSKDTLVTIGRNALIGGGVGAGFGAAGGPLAPVTMPVGVGVGVGIGVATGIVDRFMESTDQSDFSKSLGSFSYFDQVEADANKLADTEKALGGTQVERDRARVLLAKATGRINELIAENKKSTDLLKTLPAETAVKTTLIIAGYINGQITDDNQDYKTTKSLDEYKSFINSNEYKNNKTKYEVVMNADGKTGKVLILGLEGRLKAIGIDPEQIKLLALEIKEIAEEIREEIQAAEKPPTEQAEEVVKPPEEVAKTEEAKRKKQAESANNPEP